MPTYGIERRKAANLVVGSTDLRYNQENFVTERFEITSLFIVTITRQPY